MKAGPPTRVRPEIRSICEQLGLEGEPQLIDTTPTSDKAGPDWFATVDRHVKRRGGEVCYGWRFWEVDWAFVEAEFHSVWRNPEGVLLDVVPNTGWIGTRTMFIQDPKRVWEGEPVNAARRALRDDPAIEEFFRAADAESEFMLQELGDEQRDRLQTGQAMMELRLLRSRKVKAIDRMLAGIPDPGRNDPCPCGSGKKHKRCCGA